MAGNLKLSEATTNGRYIVPMIRSTFDVVNHLAQTGAQSLNQVTRSTDLPKSTVFRILSTLSHLGYVLRSGRPPTYCLSPKMSEISRSSSWLEPLRHIALPHLLKLRQHFGETVNIGKLTLDRVTYLEVVRSEHALDLNERTGEWVYAHASSLGKALLAFSPSDEVHSILGIDELPCLTPYTITEPSELLEDLKEVRKCGYALDFREANVLANCVAAPILDADGFAIAAISMSGPESRFDPRHNPKVITALRKAAARISRELGVAANPSLRHRNENPMAVPSRRIEK